MMMTPETTFDQGIEDPGDDPFAGSDFGDMEIPGDETTLVESSEVVPTAPSAAAVAAPATSPAPETRSAAEIPVVDREGQPVVPEGERFLPAPVTVPAAAQGTDPASPAAATRASVESPEEAEQRRAAMVAAQTPEPDPTPATADGSPADAQGAGVDPTPAPSAGEQTAPPAAVEAPAKAPPKAKKGERVTEREYLVFRPIEADKWELVTWYENKEGQMVAKGDPGAKKVKQTKARDNDQALAIGYAAVGSPPDGVVLVAVASSLFQPKPVRPKAQVPSKVSLQIG